MLIFGTILAIASGVFFYVRSDIRSALAVVAGFQVTLITLQVEALVRRGREVAIETRQARLIANMERLDWMPGLVDRIATSIGAVERTFPGTQIVAAGRSYLERCANDLKELERGHLKIEWEDIDLVLAQTNATRETLKATSVQAVDLDWWLSRPGRRYWDAHLAAMSRGIHVERIFIYHEWNPELQELARKQQLAGVETFRVAYSQLPPRLRTDMIVWDSSCGYETQLNAAGDGLRNFFTLDQDDIKRMLSDYSAVFSQAEPIPDEAETN